ncbi:MAG: T9SS type A sorting domain-containing protein [Sphingobacteriales bacterium]|nr:MAG: T9SS type A sorting domain-containing protein [Sphingobacteriales bacterium]
MQLNYTKVLLLLLLLVQNVSSFGQRVINAVNTPDVANFNGWVNTPNPISGYVFTGTTNRVGTTIATNGGLYAIANKGLGYRPSSSANSFTLTGTYRNNTGTAIAVGDTIQVSYRAEVIDANSRIPGWEVTVAGQTSSAFNWLSSNGTQTKTHKFVRTTAIANNTNFSLVFESDRGTGSGSSPLIGINDITVTILPAAVICATPSITSQPSDISILVPNAATFNVSAADVTSYQWQWRATASGSWANVTAAQGTGGTTATFTTVPTVQTMNGYQYRVVLTNACGSTTKTASSNVATLTLNCPLPVVTMQPLDTTVAAGIPAVFEVGATNVSTYQWQWRANNTAAWSDVTLAEGTGGTTDAFTTIATTQQMNGYQYRVVLNNICGITLTDSATLTICMPPVVTMQPLDTTVALGTPAVFEVEATNVSTYQWQWRANNAATWTNVTGTEGTGGTTNSFTTIATTQQMNGYQYRVVLTNTCGSTTITNMLTDSATLTICMPPVVTMQPLDTTVALGTPAVFEVEATNVSTYQWQWRANNTAAWTNVTATEGTGGTTDSFTTVATTQQMNGYQYRVVLTNACGSIAITNMLTDSATLTICMPPTITAQVANAIAVSGTSAVFEVAVTNATAYQWQWRANNTANWIDATILDGTGATTDSFTTIATTMAMNGYEYRVIVTNECGVSTVTNIVSDSGILTVVCPPAASITTQPAAVLINLGANAQFSVTATNVGTYQWQTWDDLTAAWLDIPPATPGYTGQNTNTLVITTPVLSMDSSKYRVVLSNLCAVTTTSGEAMLTIDAGITVTTSPAFQLSADGFTSLTAFTNTGIGQHQSRGIRYSEDGITWSSLVTGGAISSLQPNTQYYYQGYVTFDIGTFYGTVLDTFTLANVAGATTLNALAGGTTIEWTLNENNNPAYTRYAIASGTNWVQANGTLGTTAAWMTAAEWNALTVSELTPATNYCFAVKAKNNDGIETVLGAEICIMTDTAVNVSVNDIANALNSQLSVYPNPNTSGFVHLQYNFTHPVTLNVSVADMSGKLVFTHDLKDLSTGQHTLDLSKLAQGIYLMKLSAAGQSVGKKLMITK